MQKHPIYPERIRKTPKQFSWVDHRLVRDRYIDKCSHPSAALYLFLVTVADARGLSYYSDSSLLQRLNMEDHDLVKARLELVRIGLIAWQKPIYQVLALDAFPLPITTRTASAHPQLLGHIFLSQLQNLHAGIWNRDISQKWFLMPLLGKFMVFPLILGVNILPV